MGKQTRYAEEENLLLTPDGRLPKDSFNLRLSKEEQISNAAKGIFYSKSFSLFYVFIILLNVALIVWIIVNGSILKRIASPKHWLFIAIEGFINVALFGEIVLKLLFMRKSYFATWSNWFDIVILLLSLIGLAVYFTTSNSIIGEANDITTTLLLVFRYIVQFLRLVLLIKNQGRARRSVNQVDFTLLEDNNTSINY